MLQHSDPERFNLRTKSTLHIQQLAAIPRIDWPSGKAKNRAPSIDAHFHDPAGSVSLSL